MRHGWGELQREKKADINTLEGKQRVLDGTQLWRV